MVKVSLSGWASAPLHSEIKMTKVWYHELHYEVHVEYSLGVQKLRRAAHCVQSINPEQLDLAPLANVKDMPDVYDSSDPEESSGDESIDVPRRPARPPRRTRTQEELERREFARVRRIGEWRKSMDLTDRWDYLLLEYVPGGDLETLISKFHKGKARNAFAMRIPNKVLWNIWLCSKLYNNACAIYWRHMD